MVEHIDDDYSDGDPAECPECGGDGRDKWTDYLLPCPVCCPEPATCGVMVDAVAQERERCAAIADDEARIREEAGRKHPEESAARDRCFAAARAAVNVAKGIRSGEVVAGVSVGRHESKAPAVPHGGSNADAGK